MMRSRQRRQAAGLTNQIGAADAKPALSDNTFDAVIPVT
jgi:hypothetical protein